MTPKDREIQRKLKILEHAEETGNVGTIPEPDIRQVRTGTPYPD